MTVTVRAVIRARPGRRDALIATARELAAAAAGEAGTLRYDWYTTDEDPDVLVVLEEYRDSAAAMAHNEHCAALLESLWRVADLTRIDLHGAVGPQVEQWVAAHPGVAHVHRPLPG